MIPVYAEVGSSLQQIGGTCPDGWIVMQGERPMPKYVAQADGSWSLPEPDYPAVIAYRRWQAEVGGITLNGVHIDTDDRSKLLINGAALEATLDPEYVMQWKVGGGFVQLTGAQVIGIARALRAHVQACFDREAKLLAALADGTLTDDMLEQGWPV